MPQTGFALPLLTACDLSERKIGADRTADSRSKKSTSKKRKSQRTFVYQVGLKLQCV